MSEWIAVFKDGTVPVAVAQVVASDHGAELSRYAAELGDSPAHEYVELFDVEPGSRYLAVWWTESMGFTVEGYSDELDALKAIEDNGRRPTEYGPGHWNITYGAGDNESYGHVFKIGGE